MAEEIFDNKRRINLITVGDISVGKTNILNKIQEKIWSDKCIGPTISRELYSKKFITPDAESINVQIWDTPGSEKY